MISNKLVSWIAGWFGWSGGALGERRGTQFNVPGASLVPGISPVNVDTALQLDTIWACVERRANIIASLPLFTYDVPVTKVDGRKTLAKGTRLYQLLHDSPNSRMTPFVFWRSMMLNYDMRGNGYARIERDMATGETIALWPMPADQVEEYVTPDGTMFYLFSLYATTYIYDEADVLHIKNLGNGTTGLAKLEFMAPAIGEAAAMKSAAQKLFGNGGKPTAILMTDKVLRPEQRSALQLRFAEMATGSEARMFVLEADMKYQQLSATPEQLQLLASRQFSVEEICRFMDVPPVLVHHSNVTAWGTGIDSIVEGWYKTTIGPMVTAIEQAIRKRVLTNAQRATMSCEFNLDALLRVSPKSRFELYASAVQNGIMTRDECRALENLPAMYGGAATLTAQVNLAPLNQLGQIAAAATQAPASKPQPATAQ